MSTRVRIDVKPRTIQWLADELNSGKYFLPSFQRQYVWDEDDILEFIDSIIKNYPIGNIILWKPSTASISEIDPFSKPLVDVGKINDREVFYVIDGQQRLTSLILLLNNWEIERDGEKIIRNPISYNPSDKKFCKSRRKGFDLSKLIKAFYQFDVAAMSELQKATTEESFNEMRDLIKEILINYPIPICIMETDTVDEKTFSDMAEAFIRINKYGIRIGNLELMLSFLAGRVSGGLKKKVRELYEDLYSKFEIELQPVIRFAFSNFGLKQTQISKVEQFRKNIEKKISEYDVRETEEIFNKCHKAMNLTIELLRRELGLANSRLLPSQIPLIPISKYFYNKGIDSLDDLEGSDIKNIVNWFILTSFNGYYSSQTDTKLDRDLELLKSSYFPCQDLYKNMQEKNARIKIKLEDIRRALNINVLRIQGRSYLFILYILLVRSHADDWNGRLLNQSGFNNLTKHHIFPKEFLEQKLELEEPEPKENIINNLANITFIHKNINSEIEDKSPEEYLEDYINSAKRHFIPTDKNLWKINQYDTFLEYRIRQIHDAGRKFFADIFD